MLSVQPDLRGNNDEKWWPFNCFFSVQGTGGSPTGPDPENRVGDQDIGSPDRPVSSGLHVPGEPGHCRARTRPSWWPSRPAAFFPQNVLQLHQQRWVIIRADSLALWKRISEEDGVLITKNRGENFSRGFLNSEIFGGMSACPNLREWWTQPAQVRCPVAQLLIYPKFGGLSRLAREVDQ